MSNRSQCYLNLKCYPKAFTDADEALKRDSDHVKSLGRRGTACYYMHQLKKAKSDFISVLRLEPQNISFASYIEKINAKLIQVKQEAYERMNRKAYY